MIAKLSLPKGRELGMTGTVVGLINGYEEWIEPDPQASHAYKDQTFASWSSQRAQDVDDGVTVHPANSTEEVKWICELMGVQRAKDLSEHLYEETKDQRYRLDRNGWPVLWCKDQVYVSTRRDDKQVLIEDPSLAWQAHVFQTRTEAIKFCSPTWWIYGHVAHVPTLDERAKVAPCFPAAMPVVCRNSYEP